MFWRHPIQCHLILGPKDHRAVLFVLLLHSWGWPVIGQGKGDARKKSKQIEERV